MPVATLVLAPWLLAPFSYGPGRLLRPRRGTFPVRLPNFPDAIAPDEIDAFGFDFTSDMLGAARIIAGYVYCAVNPGSLVADPAPQSRILSLPRWSGTQIGAMIGNPVKGVFYDIEAKIALSDARILSLRAGLLCAT